MFELFELVLSSPLGALVFAGLQNALYAVIVALDCEDCGFNDLGTLLFGGVFAAVVMWIALSILLRRIKEKAPNASAVVSIRAVDTNAK